MHIRLLAALAALCLFVLPAQARHHRHAAHHRVHHVAHRLVPHTAASGCAGMIYDNDGRTRCAGALPEFSSLVAPYKARGRGQRRGYVPQAPERNIASGTAWQGGYARVCVSGHCGTVAARLAEQFRGLFAEFVALGYNIGSPGCLSAGHMRHSLHHWGGACDLFNQIARNVTALRQPPPSVQIEVAARHGLTAGCVWRSPDCGHFDVSGIGGGRARRVARRY